MTKDVFGGCIYLSSSSGGCPPLPQPTQVCRYVDMCVDNVWRRDHLVATVDNEPGQAAAAAAAVAVSCIIVTSNL